jgi:polyhydroxyalkanoate synthesis regulator phasin
MASLSEAAIFGRTEMEELQGRLNELDAKIRHIQERL